MPCATDTVSDDTTSCLTYLLPGRLKATPFVHLVLVRRRAQSWFPHAGEATEAAFRARHRWAARRVAHLLKGLPDRPPLQAASEVIESSSVNIGLLVEGRPFLGSSVDVVSASGGLEGNSHSSVWW